MAPVNAAAHISTKTFIVKAVIVYSVAAFSSRACIYFLDLFGSGIGGLYWELDWEKYIPVAISPAIAALLVEKLVRVQAKQLAVRIVLSGGAVVLITHTFLAFAWVLVGGIEVMLAGTRVRPESILFGLWSALYSSFIVLPVTLPFGMVASSYVEWSRLRAFDGPKT